MNFIALDVETANPSPGSICQIGVVLFENGLVSNQWSSLIDPQDEFSATHVSIHGIDANAVRNAPTWSQVYDHVNGLLSGQVVAAHTSFDRRAISRIHAQCQLAEPNCIWLDTSNVARMAWKDVAQRGYGLGPLAERFGIEFRHHDAMEDARAAGLILLRAIADTGIDLHDWIKRTSALHATDDMSDERKNGGYPYINHPIKFARKGNAAGPLGGELICFTGTLATLTREQAASIAAEAGCDVKDNVTKHTTLLVVGDVDWRTIEAGHPKSSKHLKAEEWIAKGKSIRIVSECDFLALVGKLIS